MPTIRDLVAAIRQREGVEAAVVLGRDGLLIDSQTIAGVDAEHVAAHVPSIIGAADEFGQVSGRGPLTTAILEHPNGRAVFLPEVASDHGRTREELLVQLCRKGGLSDRAWREATLLGFRSQKFRG